MTTVIYCDTQEEKFDYMGELENNPDFIYLGHFGMIQDIYEELNYQGFSDAEIEKFTSNRYGTCIDIIEYASHYEAFMGSRWL